jgi:mRNA interferase HigB
MIVIGTDVVERYFAERGRHRGIKAARAQYGAWRAIAERAQWKTPQDVKEASSEGEHSQRRPGGL